MMTRKEAEVELARRFSLLGLPRGDAIQIHFFMTFMSTAVMFMFDVMEENKLFWEEGE